MNIKSLIEEIHGVWKVAKKPDWEETKQMVLVTLSISLMVGLFGLLIFVVVQYII